jgi:mRNA interferase MazF
VWWADLDPVVGRELGRKIRPVLIVSTDDMNHGDSEKVIVVPMTTRAHGRPSHVPTPARIAGRPGHAYVCCEDVRSISVERLGNRMERGGVPTRVLAEVEQWLRVLLQL